MFFSLICIQALKEYKAELQDDPIISTHLTKLYDNLLEQNLIRVIEPFSRVQVMPCSTLVSTDICLNTFIYICFLCQQIEHISELIKLSKVRHFYSHLQITPHMYWCKWQTDFNLNYCCFCCHSLSVMCALLFPFSNFNIALLLSHQGDVERKLSQMILDQKFHGMIPSSFYFAWYIFCQP